MNNENALKKFGEIIFKFDVLYSGWECDAEGYVVRTPLGVNKLILSNHGRWYEAEPDELSEFIKTYEDAISDSQKALALLKQENI